MPAAKQLNELLECVQSFAKTQGVTILNGVDTQSILFLEWIPYLNNAKTGVADELLDGAVSSLREVAACSALGLVRPALLAMRTEIDLILSWLYFKDHSIEWEFVNSTGDGFKLKKEILEYLAKYYTGFGSRTGTLKEIMTRKEVDPYRLLSAHIHSQSLKTLPLIDSLKGIVGEPAVAAELVMLSHEVDEYINDILFATFCLGWTQIPKNLLTALNARFKSKAQKQVFYNLK